MCTIYCVYDVGLRRRLLFGLFCPRAYIDKKKVLIYFQVMHARQNASRAAQRYLYDIYSLFTTLAVQSVLLLLMMMIMLCMRSAPVQSIKFVSQPPPHRTTPQQPPPPPPLHTRRLLKKMCCGGG